jgi:hypothetical protein
MGKVDLTKGYIPSERDYKEHKDMENGNYMHHCHDCNELFIGHKRVGILCKVCRHKEGK